VLKERTAAPEPEYNLTAVLEKAPEAFALVDKKWDTYGVD
jgi:hypothetical protein